MTNSNNSKIKRRKEELTRDEETVLYWVGLVALPFIVIGAYVVVNWIIPNMPPAECVFWKCFDVYCPGCGGTRSVIALVNGKVLLSAWYHPLVLYSVIIYGLYMITHTLEKIHVPFVKGMRFRSWYLYIALIIIAVNFIFKNVLKFWFHILM